MSQSPRPAPVNGLSARVAPPSDGSTDDAPAPTPAIATSEPLVALAELRGRIHFLLYLTDQIEESLTRLADESDACEEAFLRKLLTMYSGQLESRRQDLGDRIIEVCQEVFVSVRQTEPR